ncbi:helix-turn-helix domain-containing protein [Streptomyces hirsutus]|uniref:Transcriptional regulator n=2 Tax=Streptomyces TaxID=1883 RepID=A0ABX6B4N8_9ACTN|nr:MULTISPECIES: helix-turn-helix transcriptional regulator [Streptomyces]QEV10023.1 transcriptional regulator [Streptomyces prasinus]WSD04925.1 helix-turn-helix domain-containing protein [Streptomyces hirsutus]WTD21682.1 helix-turn-helix domain-containing protein [Streptomyces hirsutus]
MRPPSRVCERCATELSQYNPDALCALCAKAETAPGVPDRAWRDEAVHRALAAWDFGELLRLVRKRSGLSQMAVRELTALPQSFISGLERGQKQIGSPATLLDLLNGLGLPSDLQPLLLTPLRGAAPKPGHNLSAEAVLPWTADRMVTSLEVAIGGTTMKRRRVLTALSGAALTQYVLQSAIAPAEAVAASSGTTTVTDALIDSLQSTTDALRQMDATSGSGNLAHTAKTHLRMLLHLLKHGSYKEGYGRRLAAVTADTAAQTGWYTFDSGDHDAAQHLFLGALRAAHASGDSRLRAGALGFLAIHGYSAGDPRDAITAPRTARQAITDHDAPALNAMLLTRQARGHARLREERHALAALAEAEELCARGRGEDDPHWLYWISPGEILGQTGSCYLDLGQPARAAQSFATARDVLSRDETRTTAQFLSRAATAQMRAGDADAGCATAHDVLTLAEGIQSARLDDHLHTMLNEARSYGASSTALELLDRGESVMRQRAAA